MDQFEDQFLAEDPENLGLSFEEEAKFFDPEAAHEADFLHPAPVEESIYTDDPVRVYLREMGAVPLLTREGEVDLARRMERGKLRMQKAISRSALVQGVVVELSEALKKGAIEIETVVDLGDVEEGSPADIKVRTEAAKQVRRRQYPAEEAPAVGGEGHHRSGSQQAVAQAPGGQTQPGQGGNFPGDPPLPLQGIEMEGVLPRDRTRGG